MNVIYLGFRGGGIKITEAIILDLVDHWRDFKLCLYLRRDTEEKYTHRISDKVTINEWGISCALMDVSTYLYFLLKALILPNSLGFTRGSLNIVTLTSPYSLPLEFILKIRGRKLVTLSHDSEKHAGDVWPPNLVISIRNFLSDAIITLSSSVRKIVQQRYPRKLVLLYPHPVFKFDEITYPPELSFEREYILFLGRIRTYKGIDKLLASVRFNYHLQQVPTVIAGEGEITADIPQNITLINRWLSDSEISGLIDRSRLVVFPYLEASQSGLIGTVIDRKKIVVVSDHEGLKEQVQDYERAWVCKDLTPLGLSTSIMTAYEQEFSSQGKSAPRRVNFLDTLDELINNI